jgi:2-succinyl-5-enolpyruvyl-6-hydroxy-3-cyclohexene-1-carboxylate synthase
LSTPPAANPSTALAAVLADEFARAGLRHAVIAPGSRSTPLAIALDADERVRVHVRVDERSAAYCALGIARAGGAPAAVVTTSGTAASIVHPAVVEADAARVPLLVLTADRPPELRHAGANQTIDQLALFGRATRWFCEVGVPEPLPHANAYWRSTACHAWAAASGAGGAPPGPVHLNLALREPLVPEGPGFGHPLDGRPGGGRWTAVTPGTAVLGAADAERLAELVASTPRGLIVAGDTSADVRPLLDLAKAAAWPLLAEPQSGIRTGPCAVSTYDLLLRSAAFASAQRPDIVLLAGRVALSRPLAAWLDASVPQVLLDPHGAWLDPGRVVGEVVAADPGATAAALAAALAPREPGAWSHAWAAAERRAREALDRVLDAGDAPSEPRTARDLAATLPDGSLLVVASSMPVRDLAATMVPRAGLRVIGNRGASGIDGFCSTAIGAALAHDGPVAGLAGDLSLLHDATGLLTPGSERGDLVVVVVNNDGGGIFSFLPQASSGAASFEKLFGTPHGVEVAALAAAYGCGYRRVEAAGGVPAAVEGARRDGGVQLVEVRTERGANVELHRRIERAVVAAVES